MFCSFFCLFCLKFSCSRNTQSQRTGLNLCASYVKRLYTSITTCLRPLFPTIFVQFHESCSCKTCLIKRIMINPSCHSIIILILNNKKICRHRDGGCRKRSAWALHAYTNLIWQPTEAFFFSLMEEKKVQRKKRGGGRRKVIN